MAQPLKNNAPPFCLCLFGTTNRFTAKDVKNRNDFIKETLSANGIQALGLSSDGDARLLKFMRSEINLGRTNITELPNGFERFFFANMNNDMCSTQDTLHIMTKLRRCLIKPDSDLTLGMYAINVAFLIDLIKMRP